MRLITGRKEESFGARFPNFLSAGNHVTDILPGYIATDIVVGVDIGKLPFAIPSAQAAREMAGLIERHVKSGVVPAFPWKPVRPFLGHLPERMARY